jgi:high-affinity K+ transport system ATPase subunit B
VLARALRDAVLKLNPAHLIRNPVIFVTEVVSILVTLLAVLAAWRGEAWGFQAGIAAWLWLTVLFATFAEAIAEGRGRARAESLRRARGEARARLLARAGDRTQWQDRAAADLREGDLILVEAGDLIPADGEARSNMHVGGRPELIELTPRDREICATIGPALKERDMIFVGIDVIGDYLTEINVTSPTGFREIKRFGGPDIAVLIWDAIEKRRQ